MSTIISQVGDQLPAKTFKVSTVQLFLYNAAIWNSHRIHYDLPYAQQQEGHPNLLVDGPLLGDFLTQMVYECLPQTGVMTAFSYTNRRAAYVDEELVATGEVTQVTGNTLTLSLTLTNQQQQVLTSAIAQVCV